MNTQEAAKHLTQKGKTCSPEQVGRWAKDGLLDGAKKDAQGRWEISIEALERFLKGRSSKRPFYQLNRFWGYLGSITTFTVLLIGFLADVGGAKTQLLDWTCISVGFGCPFSPEREGETLIVIAHFHSIVASNNDVHNKIQQAIKKVGQEEPRIHNLRIEVDSKELEAKDRDEAERIGKRYNASIVIWGEETATNVTVNLYNLKQPDLPQAQAILNETNRTQVTSQLQPELYISFVTQELPNYMTFFSLASIAASFANQRNYEAAIPVYEKAMGLLDSNLDISKLKGIENLWLDLGDMYSATGDQEQAVKYYDKVITLKPDSALAFNNRGIIYAKQENYNKAIIDYNQAIIVNPDFAESFYNRANAYNKLGDYDAAVSDYSQAIILKPDFFESFYNRANIYSKLGKHDQAITDYSQAIKLNPNDAQVFNNRGVSHAELGDFKQALADYSQAIKLKPDHVNALMGRGFANTKLGNYNQAVEDYMKVLEISTDPAMRELAQQYLDTLAK